MTKRKDGDSSISKTAKEQRAAGAAGGPQGEQTPSPTGGRQPPQTSNRRPKRTEHEPDERRSFSPAEDPNEQGVGEPRPDSVKESSAQQGFGGAGHSSGARTDEKEESAISGEPRGEQVRHGRQKSNNA